jgi:hypothetical protein
MTDASTQPPLAAAKPALSAEAPKVEVHFALSEDGWWGGIGGRPGRRLRPRSRMRFTLRRGSACGLRRSRRTISAGRSSGRNTTSAGR